MSIINNMPTKLSSVPVGTIRISNTSTARSGYLLCDGSLVSKTTYSQLGVSNDNFDGLPTAIKWDGDTIPEVTPASMSSSSDSFYIGASKIMGDYVVFGCNQYYGRLNYKKISTGTYGAIAKDKILSKAFPMTLSGGYYYVCCETSSTSKSGRIYRTTNLESGTWNYLSETIICPIYSRGFFTNASGNLLWVNGKDALTVYYKSSPSATTVTVYTSSSATLEIVGYDDVTAKWYFCDSNNNLYSYVANGTATKIGTLPAACIPNGIYQGFIADSSLNIYQLGGSSITKVGNFVTTGVTDPYLHSKWGCGKYIITGGDANYKTLYFFPLYKMAQENINKSNMWDYTSATAESYASYGTFFADSNNVVYMGRSESSYILLYECDLDYISDYFRLPTYNSNSNPSQYGFIKI